MKRLVAILAAALFLVGCAADWKTTAGKTLATTAQTVDGSMKGWAMYVVTSSPPQDQQDRVKEVYAQYQTTFDVALTAYQAAVAMNNADIWQRAFAALSASQIKLVALIESFNPTYQTKP